MTDRVLERPHARIAFEDAGPVAGQTLIVAHGLARSRAHEDAAGIFNWAPVAAAGERVVRYDTRGHGASTGRPVPEDYRWPVLAEDLLGLAETVSPGQRVDGLGISTGCGTLLWAAILAPHRFRRLVLVTPPTVWGDRAEQAGIYLALADLLEQRGEDAWLRAVAAAPLVPILAAGGWRDHPSPAVAVDLLAAVLRGAASADLPDEAAVAGLPHPTLILGWDTDPNHPVTSAHHLEAVIPDSRAEIATSPEEIRSWGNEVARFLTSTDN